MSASFTVAQGGDGHLELFALGPSNDIWHAWQLVTPIVPIVLGWSGWSRLGNPDDKGTQLAVGQNADGRLEVFLTGTATDMWHDWQSVWFPTGYLWSGWNGLGTPGGGGRELAASRNQDGRLEVFVRGGDGGLWHAWQTSAGGGWSGWDSLGGIILSPPVVGQNLDGRLEVFVQGTDGAAWHNWQNEPNGGWSGWASMGKPAGGVSSSMAVARNAAGRLQLFVLDSEGRIWHMRQT
jgi:hypothetical protein